ncbi:MAG: hypothetical protein AMS18_12505 [Gemmatimonas sp. SG8_17]|nr:MAG: hypothetical protein AMS18_12505 [Gemmatimonas sp. SG8_17]
MLTVSGNGLGTALICAFAFGCASEAPHLSMEEETQISAIGQESAQLLAASLVTNLSAAIQEGGLTHAVDFCSSEAIRLTADVQDQLGRGLVIKRTTFKFRNPANAPDDLEAAALHYFESTLHEKDSLPSYYVQRVSTDEFRYYQPLLVNQLCLQCHGNPGEIDPAVMQQLRARYPDDRATGYASGELRGLIRVSVPAQLVTQ